MVRWAAATLHRRVAGCEHPWHNAIQRPRETHHVIAPEAQDMIAPEAQVDTAERGSLAEREDGARQ
jgi:hypothetical protein